MNKVILIGRLTKDVELRTAGDTHVAGFTLAVNRPYTDKDGNRPADFINCVAWKNTAEFVAKYFEKGSQIGIVGSINTRTYDKDGQRVYVTEVVISEVHFVGDKKKEFDV